jgi:hypothetical protein
MGKEVRTVKSQAEMRIQIARSYRAEQIREAAQERRIESAPRRRQARSIRRSIGYSIIRIGERMAAESPVSSARSIGG